MGKAELISAYKKEKMFAEETRMKRLKIHGFDAGDAVHNPDKKIEGTGKTYGEMYSNLKAQTYGITAQKYYNTFRFVELGERDIAPSDMISIDIEDDHLF